MPELDAEAYLWIHLSNAGLCMSGFNGAIPLTSVELDKWAERSGVYLSPWEFSTILACSRAYCSKLARSKNPEEPPPFGRAAQEIDRAKVAKTISNNFKAFIAATQKKGRK